MLVNPQIREAIVHFVPGRHSPPGTKFYTLSEPYRAGRMETVRASSSTWSRVSKAR